MHGAVFSRMASSYSSNAVSRHRVKVQGLQLAYYEQYNNNNTASNTSRNNTKEEQR